MSQAQLEPWLRKADQISRLLNQTDPLLEELISLAPNEVIRDLSLRLQLAYDLFCLTTQKDVEATSHLI